MPKLVNLGSACIDQVYRVRALAGAGETVSSKSHQTFPGGKGLNQSLAAAKAGASVCHVGCVGEDGAFLRQVLVDAGVDVTGLRTVSEAVSGHAVIQVDEQGQNAIVIAGGANRCISVNDLSTTKHLLAPGDWLLLQNEINDLPAALELARGTGARTAFNLAPVDGREAGYDLGAVDLLIVNEIESRALAPASIAAKDDASVAGWLAETYPGLDVVLTAGGEGLVHAGAGGIASVPAFPVEPVDETAAGDAFIGYLLAGLLEGMEMADALRLGSAAGALAVTRDGAATSIPDRCAVLEQVG
jgi:ribokinase